MARNQSYFSIKIIFQIILVVIVAKMCENADRFDSDFEKFKKGLFSIRELDISKMISETVFSNWSDNYNCSIEMDAIKSALSNSEEWAFKSELNFCEQ